MRTVRVSPCVRGMLFFIYITDRQDRQIDRQTKTHKHRDALMSGTGWLSGCVAMPGRKVGSKEVAFEDDVINGLLETIKISTEGGAAERIARELPNLHSSCFVLLCICLLGCHPRSCFRWAAQVWQVQHAS